MKKNSLMVAATIVLGASSGLAANADLAKRQCRSVHLWLQPKVKLNEKVELFYNEMQIEESSSGSYFMAAGFNGGYFGLQELYRPGQKIALFSVWEPGNPHDLKARQDSVAEDKRVKVLGSGEGVHVQRFGGEGTGAQSKLPFPWKKKTTYRFIVTAKEGEKPKGTIFSGYLYHPEEKQWKLMATFHTRLKYGQVAGTHTFVEDFRRNFESATKVRKASYGNSWVRTTEGKWHPLAQARFTADATPSQAINAGKSKAVKNGFFLQTGGETKNEKKLYSWMNHSLSEEAKLKLAPPTDILKFPKP